jgi:uncharacterized protein
VIGGTVLGNAVSGAALIATFALVMLAAAAATWRKTGAVTDQSRRAPSCPPLQLSRDTWWPAAGSTSA